MLTSRSTAIWRTRLRRGNSVLTGGRPGPLHAHRGGDNETVGSKWPLPLRERLLDNHAPHVREPLIAAAVEVGEQGVVEAQQVQDRGVKVGDMRPLLDGVEAELVGRAE